MAGHECYHCKQWVEEGDAHDCWTTTEKALTEGLTEDLQDAWVRLREAAAELGDQRIYASHNSIMFARKACYAFVRPKKSFLELVIFLGRTVRAPQIRRAEASSKTKVYHVVPIRHRDEVEAPITDWLAEAYRFQDAPPAAAKAKPSAKKPPAKRKAPAKKKTTPAKKRPRVVQKKGSAPKLKRTRKAARARR